MAGLGEVEVFPAAQVHFQRRRMRPRFEFRIESFPLVSTATNFRSLRPVSYELTTPGDGHTISPAKGVQKIEVPHTDSYQKDGLPTWATREEKFEAKELKPLQWIVT